MDNYDSFIFDGLLDRYIEEQAKFKNVSDDEIYAEVKRRKANKSAK